MHTFKKNYKINERDIELFEPSKILGDVFESLLGAVYVDGGIKAVLEVYKHIMSPFILFTAKFSKILKKEAKEDFNILANLMKIKPQFQTNPE